MYRDPEACYRALLITETRLGMTEVALAAGFGSVRRFNGTFRALYGRAPHTLRRGAVDAAAVTLLLRYKPPYDWPAMIGFLSARAIPGVEHVRPDRYARTIAIGEAQGTIEVRPGDRALLATIRFPAVTALPAIVERIRRLFDLGADPAVIGRHLAADPRLAPLVAARPGLRVPGTWDGFELAVRAILGQQITVGAATRLAGQLAGSHGARLPAGDGPLRLLFPTPAQLVGGELTLGMPRARVAAIVSLAACAVATPGLFAPAAALDDALDRLRALPGIGEWTAQYIAMRALREPDAFPAADVGLQRAMATSAGRSSTAELLARSAPWRPRRGYAALHLWTELAQGDRLAAAA